jgi:hypothetical protein
VDPSQNASHRYARESYDDAAIEAAATIVARYVGDWYRHAMPDESARIDADIDGWLRSIT